MGFPDSSEVASAIESGSTGPLESQPGAGSDLAPEGGSSVSPPSITDLDKLEKFRFEGQELTPQELKKAMLRQQDYSRKTQEFSKERQAYAEERKFVDNLRADLRHVRENPAKADEFRRIYPQKFHAYLEDLWDGNRNTSQSLPQTPSGNQPKYAELDPHLIREFNELKGSVQTFQQERFQKEVEANESMLEQQEKTLGSKYPMADIENVYAKAQAILDRNANLPKGEQVKLDSEIWDRLYKAEHEKNQARYEAHYKETIQKQKQAGLKAKDSGAGGAMAGSSPKRYRNIKEATEAALDELDS